jgi:hypothetical protein
VRSPTRRLRTPDHDYDLAVVERAPLPPHERSWRHPSELAADARQAITDERPSGSARTAALLGGMATIMLFGVAILSLTPTADDGPAATGSTPIQRLASGSLTVPSTTSASQQTQAETPGPASGAIAALGPAPAGPLAVEIGTGGLAVLPSRTVVDLLRRDRSNDTIRSGPRIDVVGRTDVTVRPAHTIVVTLHSGVTALASVIDAGDGRGLAVVSVEGDHHRRSGGFLLATDTPESGDIVTVLSDEPISITWDEMRDFDGRSVPDGTAVVDVDGDLVGVYADSGVGGRFIPIDDAAAGATSRD